MGNGSRKGHVNESDYEEIGPPVLPNKSQMNQAEQPAANGTGGEICDLCGTAVAIVKCAACSEQIFCLACDDMYHRHPKRTTHARKALSNSQPIRPPLPPKGDAVATPVAPPRKNLRKGSAPDSPVTQHQTHLATRSSTLPRKAGSMVGRPLPPPPPVVEANPPPALPAKNINPPPPVPPPQLPHQQQQTSFYPNDNNGLMQQRKMSIHSQAPPMHFQQQPDIPLPAGYPMAAGSSLLLITGTIELCNPLQILWHIPTPSTIRSPAEAALPTVDTIQWMEPITRLVGVARSETPIWKKCSFRLLESTKQ